MKRRKFPKHYSTLLDSFTEQCETSCKESAYFVQKGHTRSLRRGKLPPKTPKWPKRALEVTSMRPKLPQSPLKVIPGAPKTNPSAPKWSPKASPDPLKSIKKGVQDHPGTPLRKRPSPRCENPIIYYVLSTSGNLIFLKSDENLIIYYVLELPKKSASLRPGPILSSPPPGPPPNSNILSEKQC